MSARAATAARKASPSLRTSSAADAADTGDSVEAMAIPSQNDDAHDDERERRIRHFIPSVELRGSNAAKVATLDRLIRHLERLRSTLAGVPPAGVRYEHPNPHAGDPLWPWWATGVFIVGLVILITGIARSCA